jgi:TPR repeat protein
MCATAGAGVAHACKGDDLAECSAQCEKGNGESCYQAARLKLLHATGDLEKLEALGFDMKGCDDLYGPACRGLGYIFELAYAEESDPVKQAEDASSAISYYEKACNAGDGEACQHAADCYADGRIGVRDAAKTVKLTTRGCDLGFARSCTELASIRIEGKHGAAREGQAGIDRLQTACNQPNGAAYCVQLGDYYRRGTVAQKDAAKALDAYERGCARYSTDACGKKGEMLARGDGVAADFVQAKTYLRRACPELDWGGSSGDPGACAFMGEAYEAGTFGFARDPAHALEIYEERCQRWPGSAMCAMAAAKYEPGGVAPRDPDRASALYLRGCDYGTGDGVACVKAAPAVVRADPKQGLAMYRRACFAGKDSASCLTVGDILAKDAAEKAAANAKSFYLRACEATQLADVCARSAALGKPAATPPGGRAP